MPANVQCDGYPDCPDGEDEAGCPGTRQPQPQYVQHAAPGYRFQQQQQQYHMQQVQNCFQCFLLLRSKGHLNNLFIIHGQYCLVDIICSVYISPHLYKCS